jgi:hypothetical protein
MAASGTCRQEAGTVGHPRRKHQYGIPCLSGRQNEAEVDIVGVWHPSRRNGPDTPSLHLSQTKPEQP